MQPDAAEVVNLLTWKDEWIRTEKDEWIAWIAWIKCRMNKKCIGEWMGTEKDEWIVWMKCWMNKDWKDWT